MGALRRRAAGAPASERLAFVQAVGFILLVAVGGGWLLGFPALLFSAAFLGGLALWAAVFLGRRIDPAAMLPSYLFTVAIFVVHVGEEYWGHMENILSSLSGVHVPQSTFLAIAAFAAPAIWILGGALLAANKPFGRFIMCTFYFGMIGGELSHFAFPFMTDGRFRYSAGMVTAPLLTLSALYSLRKACISEAFPSPDAHRAAATTCVEQRSAIERAETRTAR